MNTSWRPSKLKPTLLLTLSLLVSSGLLACQRNLTPETGCHFLQNQDQQRVSWNQNTPIPLYIHSSVPPEAYPAIEGAIQTYSTLLGRPVFEIRGYGVSGNGPSRDGSSFIYWMSEWEADRPKEQGRTTVYWSGNTIYEADVRINASSLSSFVFHYNSSEPVVGVDLKSLFIHELGHALGLDHNDLAGSIMNTHLQDGVERVVLSPEDTANLQCEYQKEG